MRNSLRFFIASLLILLVLSSCQNSLPQSQGEQQYPSVGEIQVTISPPTAAAPEQQARQMPPTMEPYVFKTSEPGTLTLHGMLIVMDPTIMLPAPDDAIHLVPIPEGEGISTVPHFEMGEVPQAEVDERTGEYTITNVEPGKYAIVVRTKGGAQIPARKMSDLSLAIFTFDASQKDTVTEVEPVRIP